MIIHQVAPLQAARPRIDNCAQVMLIASRTVRLPGSPRGKPGR